MCVNLSPAAAATAAATVSVVVMVIPVWVVEVMVPFSSSLSPDGVSLVMMVAYLRTIDVEILNIFSLESSLLKPLKNTRKSINKCNGNNIIHFIFTCRSSSNSSISSGPYMSDTELTQCLVVVLPTLISVLVLRNDVH